MLAVVLLILAGAAPTARAADQPVTIVGSSFSPDLLAINVGDSVTWTNNDPIQHTVTSDNSAWVAASLFQGNTFQHTFNQAGLFSYFCSIHFGMRGAILVGTRTYLPLVAR
jgi:plastocyanin